MADSTVAFRCPNCDAGLAFNAEKQKFCCEFCLSEFDLAELEGSDAQKKAEEAAKQGEEYCESMREYYCPNCGAEISADEHTAADFCCYCHNPVVLRGKLSGQMRPDKVVPFRFDREEAEQRFLSFAKKKWFVPRGFFRKSQADKIRGIYYPFWVTDADTDARVAGSATKVRTWSDSRYRYTETSHFGISRAGNIHFEDITTSAFSQADKQMLEGILPYPSDALEPFSMPYLSGFLAKKRDIERQSLTDEVRSRMYLYAEQLLRATVQGYTTVNLRECGLNIRKSHWEYTLMPIWLLIYKGKKRDYTYAMNGCTGKIYGEEKP